MKQSLISKCVNQNKKEYFVNRATTPEEIDEVCRFRATRFAQKGIYSPDTISDEDHFDSNPNTFLLYVREKEGIIGTIRIIKKLETFPQLPIYNCIFKDEESSSSIRDLEAVVNDKKLLNPDSQLTGLVISEKYCDKNQFHRGLAICASMFSNIHEISKDYSLFNAIICSIPTMTKLYKSLEAKTHYSGYFAPEKNSQRYRPLDLLTIKPNNTIRNLSTLVNENSQTKDIPIVDCRYRPEREARACSASV